MHNYENLQSFEPAKLRPFTVYNVCIVYNKDSLKSKFMLSCGCVPVLSNNKNTV